MYDRNGLELTSVSDAKTAYKHTAANVKQRNYSAVVSAKGANFRMQTIGQFNDDRDAAFIGQEFARLYDEIAVGQMVVDGTFREIADTFVLTTDTPEWQYPSEGMTFDEMIGDETYTKNRVASAREALVEAINTFNQPTPPIKEAKKLIEKVEQLYKGGISYREAARVVLGVQ